MKSNTTLSLLASVLTLSVACTGSKDAGHSGETGDTSADTDSGAEATNGIPEGESTWNGTVEVNGYSFLFDTTIDNDGGDLEATATIADDPDAPVGIGTGTFTLTGTHEPNSGLVALAPLDWVVEPDLTIELDGVLATYDPETRTLTGVLQDYASGSDNTLQGGPLSATLVSGDGEATVEGDRAADLSAGTHSFTGTVQCTGSERESAGTLDYDGNGAVSGTITLGDTTIDTPLGTFAFTGVFNPSTGGLTLVPGLWDNPTGTTLTFFVDGTYTPGTGAFEGDLRTNTNACPPGTWHAVIQ